MKKILCLLPIIAVLPLSALEITPAKKDHTYKTGEKIIFNIQLDKGRANTAFSVDVQGIRFTAAENKLVSDADGKAVLSITASQPGVIRVLISDNGKSAAAAVAVEKEAIRPAREMPENFHRYWKRSVKELDLVPVQYEINEISSEKKDFKTFDVKILMPGENTPPLHAVLTMPQNAIPGRCAAMIVYHDSNIGKAMPVYYPGTLTLSVNPLPVKHNGSQGETLHENGAFYNSHYQLTGNVEENCFQPMIKRACRAVQFMRDRMEWDGRTMIVRGTGLGGAQALAVAGLDQKISMCAAVAPALCNHGGFENGSESGWPAFHRNAAAYQSDPDRINAMLDLIDICFFAANIRRAEVCIFTGFNDRKSPASSVFAAYNMIPSEKKIILTDFHSIDQIPEKIATEMEKRIAEHIRRQQTFR